MFFSKEHMFSRFWSSNLITKRTIKINEFIDLIFIKIINLNNFISPFECLSYLFIFIGYHIISNIIYSDWLIQSSIGSTIIWSNFMLILTNKWLHYILSIVNGIKFIYLIKSFNIISLCTFGMKNYCII